MILVVGSTGNLGSEICRHLTASGKAVRALVRSTSAPEKVAQLITMGVETVLGDLRDPASLAAACRGVQAVITTATAVRSMQPGDSIPITDQQGQLNLVRAARQADVSKFVYTSFLLHMEACPLTTAKRTVEQAVMTSGMDYTIFCPSYYMEVWLSPAVGFDYTNARASIYGDGHAENQYISREDIAEYAVQSLENPAAHNAVFELGQPQIHSQLEVVRIFEQAGRKSFDLQFIPSMTLETQRDSAMDPLQVSFAALMHNLATGIQGDPTQAQKAFPSIALKSITQYAAETIAAGIPG